MQHRQIVSPSYKDVQEITLKNSIMKTTYRLQTLVFVLSLSLVQLLTGCKKEVDSLIIKPNTLTLAAGDTYQLRAGVFPDNAPQDVKWSSSNSKVAAVDGNGLVTAVGRGSCKITVKAGSVAANCVVRVTGRPAEFGFTVAEDGRRVQFAPGNLQYQASTNTWRFAEHQYDYVGDGGQMGGNVPGSDNCKIDSLYDGWIDLFGWATSGWHDEKDPDNKYYHPWSHDIAKSTPNYNHGGCYGPSYYGPEPPSGRYGESIDSRYDWGVYNLIYNPQTEMTDRAGTWRTLTSSEWDFLLEERTTETDFRYAKAMVNGVKGLVIFPDEWDGGFVFQNPNREKGCSYEDNTLNDSDWLFCESWGCVFLPAAGFRKGTILVSAGNAARYWSLSRYHAGATAEYDENGKFLCNTVDAAFGMYFSYDNLYSSRFLYDGDVFFRYYGCSVRLVKDMR